MKLSHKKKQNIITVLAQVSAECCLDAIVDIVEGEVCRSPQQNKYYWAVLLQFFSDNTPEYLLKIFQIEHMTPESWHIFCKSKFKKDSTAFSAMEADEFTEYIENCKLYFSTLTGCSLHELNESLSEV
jgi:hypothetical protein